MKVIIFGATGTVGIEIVKQALKNGDEVTAFVRDPRKMQNISHPNLYIHVGDVLSLNDVENALQNQEAVFCALGDGRKGKIRAEGTKNIIEAMRKKGLNRLICQTTLGLGESYGNLNFIWKHVMFGMLLKKAFQDHKLQEKYILDSNLDYTIVRPSAFTDDQITNTYRIGFDGSYKELNLKIARKEVADFMIRQLNTNEYLKRTVSISN
ncbi:NAD(P)-dependent oxidoreductase [Flavobacterium anhuiense]|uniref:NAD(P)-dependent oxidoreductase n=1 Tax=Flavobacterium anhuiense TaxID=459526 RepID=UPI002026F245|nr:SDR family oxidoreductase [Flavobacterium anhuiense]URM38647.1 SDR family oxidoreductase [Flavobacterium anhuiense]